MKLRFPRIPRDGSWFDNGEIYERDKSLAELRKKYAEELRVASWWKRFWITLRLHREAARIFRHRLYSAQPSPSHKSYKSH